MEKQVYENLSPELREKLKKELAGCQDAAAVSEVLSKNGIQADMAQCETVFKQFGGGIQELDLEDMETAAGGCGSDGQDKCPSCGSTDVGPTGELQQGGIHYECRKCGYWWQIS